MILAGDVGGTNLRLALYARDGAGLAKVHAERYDTASFRTLEDAVLAFRAAAGDGERIEAAGFGVAAPVSGGVARLTNSPLVIDARRIASALDDVAVAVVNDLEAIAAGLALVPEASFETLLPGAPGASGNRAVIAAGTGLGEALLVRSGNDYVAVATEGGHADFAPRTPLEQRLLSYLWAEGDAHVSYEDVLSGDGIGAIHRFLVVEGASARAPGCDPERAEDPNRAITESALRGRCGLCEASLSLFCSVYGAEAGNLALKCMARGGVVLAGGIAPRILPLLRGPAFREGFLGKGRFRALMETIPVAVCTDGDAGLLGAAVAALAA